MALQQDFLVKNGMVVRNTATISTIDSFLGTSTDLISAPTLNLNFTSGTLDPRISFSRPSGASYVDRAGYIKYATANQPRFDYSPSNTGTIVGLSLEEQRTNIYPNSQNFTATTWNQPSCPYVINGVTAPDGSQTGFLLTSIPNVASSFGSGNYSYVFTSTYTRSVYAKAISGVGQLWWQISPNQINYYAPTYDLINGVVLSNNTGTATMVNAGNGWWRCIHTFNTTGVVPIGDSWFIGGYGTGPTTSTVAFWGAQMEQGNFVTSYIPTGSVSVTRANDSASIAGQNFNNFINQTQGTLFIDCTSIRKQPSIDYSQFLVLGGTNPNSDSIGIYAQTAGATQGYFAASIRANGNGTGFDSLATQGTPYTGRAAFAYQVGDANSYSNGSINQPTGVPSLLPVVNSLLIFGQASYQPQPSGWVRRISYWPRRLPNSQLQQLTTASIFTGTNFANLAPRTTYTANTSNFTVQQGVVVCANLEIPDIDKLYVTNLQRPTQPPSLNLNFLRGTLDPRITFTRSSGATVVGPDGYIKYVGNNTPRFNYSTTSTGTCLGLLIEEQRTNLLPYSSLIGGTNWNVRAGTTSTLTAGLAPDGSNNATLVTNTSGDGYVWQYYTFSPLTSYTFSFYATKASGSPTIAYQIWTGLVGYGTSAVTLASNYTRYTLSFTTTATVTSGDLGFYIQSGSAWVWGAQLEVGTFATSIIPTTNATVTRAVDYTSITGQNLYSWYNPLQGTIYTESDSITTATQTGAILDISDISDASRISIYRQSDKQPVVQYYIPSPLSNVQIGLGAIWTDLSVRKLGTSYSANNFYIASNAVTSSTLTAGAVPGNISRVSIGSFTSGASPANGHIRRVVYYPVQLSNTATYALTIL